MRTVQVGSEGETMKEVVIRIWNGCQVRHVLSVTGSGSTSLGDIGGAENSTNVDIELDPWAGLIVDHRAEYPAWNALDVSRPEWLRIKNGGSETGAEIDTSKIDPEWTR